MRWKKEAKKSPEEKPEEPKKEYPVVVIPQGEGSLYRQALDAWNQEQVRRGQEEGESYKKAREEALSQTVTLFAKESKIVYESTVAWDPAWIVKCEEFLFCYSRHWKLRLLGVCCECRTLAVSWPIPDPWHLGIILSELDHNMCNPIHVGHEIRFCTEEAIDSIEHWFTVLHKLIDERRF